MVKVSFQSIVVSCIISLTNDDMRFDSSLIKSMMMMNKI